MSRIKSYLTAARLTAACACVLVIVGSLMVFNRAFTTEPLPTSPVASPQGVPMAATVKEEQEELAEYMGKLQVYTHKLSLSVASRNQPLAGLYLHESLALLEEIQETFPEYERIPVALFIDRMALAGYEPLKAALAKPVEKLDRPELDMAMEVVVQTCNNCHAASQLPFIRIERNPFNPFLQDFKPLITPP